MATALRVWMEADNPRNTINNMFCSYYS